MPPLARFLAALLVAATLFWVGWMGIALALASLAYIFLFGDSTWPGWAEPAIMTVAIGGGALLGLVAGWTVWSRWRSEGVDG